MNPSSFWLHTIFPFSEHICVPARFRISNCAKTHTQWPTKHHVQMWPDQARGLCGWRCIPVIVMCVCVSGPAAGVCLSLVCVTRDTDRRLRLVDARVLWPWEIYGFVNSAGSGPAHVFVMRQVSAQFSQGVSVYYFSLIAHDIYSLCEMLSFYDAIVQVSVNLEVGSDCCWLLHIDNQTHRIMYSTYIEPQQFWPRISNCQKYTIDPTMP